VNVRSPAEVAIPWLHLEVRNAATVAVYALQSVLRLATKSGTGWRSSTASGVTILLYSDATKTLLSQCGQ
jgi:hypothetical protein